MAHKLKYRVLPWKLAVARAAAGAEIPAWALAGEFASVVRTPSETSFVCEEGRIPQDHEGIVIEAGWVALGLEGPFPFAMTGVLAAFIEPLANAGISVFAMSTFDTDYVLVKQENLAPTLVALGEAGHQELQG